MTNVKDIINLSKNLTLLYVEDNKDTKEASLIAFEEFFDEIITAENGEMGFNKFQENKNSINIIITDINMPKLNGIDMISKIRELNSNVPILILSAHDESNYFLDSIKLGVDGYLLKPIELNQFFMILDKITQKIQLEKEIESNLHFLQEYEEITNESSIVIKTDANGMITFVNKYFCDIYEDKKENIIGQKYKDIMNMSIQEDTFLDIKNTLKSKKIWKGVLKNSSKNKKRYYLKVVTKAILDVNKNIIEYISLMSDVTSVMNPKKQFLDALENLEDPFLVYMKLDEFNILEEFYDSATVEHIQDKVALYLESNMPTSLKFDKVYRLENGEYALINEKSICVENKNIFIENILKFQSLIKNDSVDIGDIDYDMSLLICLSCDNNQLLENSKLGIKELIKTKKQFIISNNLAKKEEHKALENIKTISTVKKALNNFNDYKIVSHFQPIINNKTKKIEKYESLVRLIDNNGEVFSPIAFLDTAKKGKYYSQITALVLDNSFEALANTNMDISINLSALDIEHESTRSKIFELLTKNIKDANRIVIELLEDEGINNFHILKDFINAVKSLGVKIAIDDFGAGYSNYERLLEYHPDILKIDGCLIRDIETNTYSLSVVKNIVSFAKEQNILTVAEYVENENIFNILKGLGVDYSQGYYFGKPEILMEKK